MSFLSDAAGRVLSLDDEADLLKTLGKLAAHADAFRELAGDSDYSRIYGSLLQTRPPGPELVAALTRAGVSEAQFRALGLALQTHYEDRFPPRLKRLLEPVGHFRDSDCENSGEVQWQLLSLDEAWRGPLSDQPLRYAMSADAQAQVEFEAGDRVYAEEDFLFRLSLAGDLQVDASLAATLDYLDGAAAVTRSSARSLSYWYRIPDGSDGAPCAAIAAGRLLHLPSPFDLSGIARALERDGLDRIQVKGGQTIAGTIGLEFDIGTFSGAAGALVDAAKIEFSAQIRRSRELDLLCYATHGHSGSPVSVELNYSRASDTGRGVAWQIGIDISEVAGQVTNYIEAIDSRYRELLDAGWGDYLKPGSWLQREAAELRDRLLDSLLDAIPESRDYLGLQLGRELDGFGGLLEQSASQATKRLLGRLQPALASRIPPGLQEEVEKLLGELQSSLDASLAGRIAELGEQAQVALADRVAQIAGELELDIAGHAVAADRAHAGVRAFLVRAESAIRRLGASLERAARAKLGIRFTHEEQLRRGGEAHLTLCFSAVDQQAEAIYRSLFLADFERLEQLREQPPAGVDVRGSLAEVLSHTVRRGAEVGFVGIELSRVNLLGTQARFNTDRDGNITVSATLSGSAALRSPWESQSVGYLSHMRLQAARRSGHGSVGLTARHRDSDLKPAELARFLGALFEAGLISRRCVSDCEAALGQRATTRSKVDATITARLDLDAEGLRYLMGGGRGRAAIPEPVSGAADPGGEEDSGDTWRRHIELVLEAVVRGGAFTREQVMRAARDANVLSRARLPGSALPADIFLNYQPISKAGQAASIRMWEHLGKSEFAATHTARRYAIDATRDRDLRNSVVLHQMIKGYWLLQQEVAVLIELEPGPDTLAAIAQAHERMAFYLGCWMQVKRAFLTHPDDELHSHTIAFFVLLAMDAGVYSPEPERGCMSISLEFGSEDQVHTFA